MGFIFLLGLMFVLNNNLEKNTPVEKNNATIEIVDSNIEGIAPLVAQVPGNTEGSLPIKLISSLNSKFLSFINYSFEFKNRYQILYEESHFLIFYHKIQKGKLLSYLISAKNKDIQ